MKGNTRTILSIDPFQDIENRIAKLLQLFGVCIFPPRKRNFGKEFTLVLGTPPQQFIQHGFPK